MKNDFVIAIAQLSAEKNLDAETVYSAVESALASAYKKDDLEYADVVVTVDRATGDEHVKRRYLIMDDDDIEDDEDGGEALDQEEATDLEQRSLATEERHEIARLLADTRALPLDSKAERLLEVIETASACGFGQGIPRPLRRLIELFGDRIAAEARA